LKAGEVGADALPQVFVDFDLDIGEPIDGELDPVGVEGDVHQELLGATDEGEVVTGAVAPDGHDEVLAVGGAGDDFGGLEHPLPPGTFVPMVEDGVAIGASGGRIDPDGVGLEVRLAVEIEGVAGGPVVPEDGHAVADVGSGAEGFAHAADHEVGVGPRGFDIQVRRRRGGGDAIFGGGDVDDDAINNFAFPPCLPALLRGRPVIHNAF